MKKRDIYFIVFVVIVVGLLLIVARQPNRFPKMPANEYHQGLEAPNDCIQCHQHPGPKGWSLPTKPSFSPHPPPTAHLIRPVVPTHPNKTQCLRCHELEKNKRP